MAEQAKLERVIGVPGIAASCFNAIVGVGIFALPGHVAGVLGPAAIIAYGICLVLVALVALCFAEAGSRVSASGGMYAFADAAFGPVVAGVSGALVVFAGSIATAAALVRYLLDILAKFVPAFASPLVGAGFLFALYGFLAAWNVRGAKLGSGLTIAATVIKLAPLLLLVVIGVAHADPANLAVPAMPSTADLGAGTLLLVYAFLGVDGGSYVSGETRDPARTVPRAIALAVASIAVLYIGLQIGAQGVLGHALGGSETPLVDLAGAVLGPVGTSFMLVATMLSLAGYIVNDMLISPRVVFALAEHGQLPRFLSGIHPRFHTPATAIPLYALAVVVVALSGSFRQIAIFGTAGLLLLYLMVSLSVLSMRRKGIAQAGTPFVAPAGALVPLAASALAIWVLSSLSRAEMVATGGFVLVFAAIYALREVLRRRALPAT